MNGNDRKMGRASMSVTVAVGVMASVAACVCAACDVVQHTDPDADGSVEDGDATGDAGGRPSLDASGDHAVGANDSGAALDASTLLDARADSDASEVLTDADTAEDFPPCVVSKATGAGNPTHVTTVAAGGGDMTSAIQAALDAAGKSGGGKVMLQSGTYTVSKTIRVPSKIDFTGAGQNRTTLVASDGANVDPIITTDGNDVANNTNYSGAPTPPPRPPLPPNCRDDHVVPRAGSRLSGLARPRGPRS